MATASLTGNVATFTRSFTALVNPILRVHPVGSTTVDGYFLADRPMRIILETDGSFFVSLEVGHQYYLECTWTDDQGERRGQSATEIFRMPSGGGEVGDVIGPPAANGMIRILRSAPGSNIFDQYSYNEVTGDLYERQS